MQELLLEPSTDVNPRSDYSKPIKVWNTCIKDTDFKRCSIKDNGVKSKIRKILLTGISQKVLGNCIVEFIAKLKSNQYILSDLPTDFLTFENFLFVSTDEFDSFNFNNRYSHIELTSESFCYDILNKDFEKYRKSFSKDRSISSSVSNIYDDILFKKVGDDNWKIQRIMELLSQINMEYLETHNLFFNNDEITKYFENLRVVSNDFFKFLNHYDTQIGIGYYFITERPFKLFQLLRDFLKENYSKGNFTILFIKSDYFKNQFKDFLLKNNFMDVPFNKRFSKLEYRRIAKEANRLYFGDVVGTIPFDIFLSSFDKKAKEIKSTENVVEENAPIGAFVGRKKQLTSKYSEKDKVIFRYNRMILMRDGMNTFIHGSSSSFWDDVDLSVLKNKID